MKNQLITSLILFTLSLSAAADDLAGSAMVPAASEVRDAEPVAVDGTDAARDQVGQGSGGRKEVQVIVDRVAVVALARHDDDQPPGSHTTQFVDGLVKLRNVLECVSADHRIEGSVRERQPR